MNRISGIKRKFILLIAGVIIIPILTAMMLFVSAFLHSPFAGAISPLKLFLTKKIPEESELNWKNLKENFLPWDDSQILVFDHNTLIFSSLNLSVGSTFTEAEIQNLLAGNQDGKQLFSYRHRIPEEKDIRVFILFPKDTYVDFTNKNIKYGMLVVLILIAFTVLMALVILRSISKSVKYLESATRKIANGDLDFTIGISGKDEFASFANSFEIMRNALREEREARARTLMGVSHDLKTPLASIKGYIEALQDNLDSTAEQRQKYLSIAAEKADVLQERISDLINYVKMETGEWEHQFEEINASDFFNEISHEINNECSIRFRSFKYASSLDGRWIIKADKKLLRRVFENIIDNSIQYSKPEDSISLTVSSGEAEIKILIQDSGRGIPENLVNDIFKPFVRGDLGRNSKGFGLGLTIVQTIIKNHGGNIRVNPAEGKGTGFAITLPAFHDAGL
ncbi:MAG: HAMP domain-containing histidine kinase [Spirochaetales bacterium]|nr:HAMP domain-containing histidine kinase [Spirochaetales bacterium]